MKRRSFFFLLILTFSYCLLNAETVTFFTPEPDWSFITGLSLENGKDFDSNTASVDFGAECDMNQMIMNAGMKFQPSQIDFSTEFIYWPEFLGCTNVGVGSILHTDYYHDIYCEVDFLAGIYAKYRTPKKFDCMLNFSFMTKQARIFAIEDKVPWLGNNTCAFRTEFNFRPVDKLDIFLSLASYSQFRYMLFLAPDFKLGVEYAALPVFSIGGQVEIQYIDMFTLSSNLNSVDVRLYSRVFLKWKKLIAAIAILLSLVVFSGCQYYSYGLDEFFYRSNTVDNRAKNLLDLGTVSTGGDDSYEVLIITDVHFGGENKGNNGDRGEDLFCSWISNVYGTKDSPKAGKTMPKFMICLGDVAEHGLEEEFANYQAFTNKVEEQFGIKTYNVIGNHDLYNAGWSSYEKHCLPGTSFYKFRTKNFTWYFVDSASGSLGNSQLMTFKRDMDYLEPGRKKLVFTHVPAYANGLFYFVMQNTSERNKFISYCADNKVINLLVGHTHKEITSNIGFTEYNFPGFLEKRGFGIMTVNETEQTAYCRTVYFY